MRVLAVLTCMTWCSLFLPCESASPRGFSAEGPRVRNNTNSDPESSLSKSEVLTLLPSRGVPPPPHHLSRRSGCDQPSSSGFSTFGFLAFMLISINTLKEDLWDLEAFDDHHWRRRRDACDCRGSAGVKEAMGETSDDIQSWAAAVLSKYPQCVPRFACEMASYAGESTVGLLLLTPLKTSLAGEILQSSRSGGCQTLYPLCPLFDG
ncbi:hypothetical protein C7M84_012013 [Penaeus vannamei]|uniref:Uncharacterized protein n=1 Tax=Penaeus vannamei TaxID=6689 RepID=A0A3R7M282_PENVA|nr:hypothetical protein C7M84_012013 [Penaeus vannamei]